MPDRLNAGTVEVLFGGQVQQRLIYETQMPCQNVGCYKYDPAFMIQVGSVWQAGDTVQARASGGQYPAFTISGRGPDLMHLVAPFTGTVQPVQLKVGDPIAIQWTAGSDPSRAVEISLGASNVYIRCRVHDTGRFTIPWATAQPVYQQAANEIFLFIDRYWRTVDRTSNNQLVGLVLDATSSQWLIFKP